ncbi:serine protease [Deinococcus sp. YIM 134068]|uniref:S1 family peptidase n=1 Tax=Deinococcus lichenicola TaxID=3118910 RepID=UPI002F93C991
MSNLPQVVEQIHSGVVHLQLVLRGKVEASATGFMVQRHLITNNHVLAPLRAQRDEPEARVVVRSSSLGSRATAAAVELSLPAFLAGFQEGSPEEDADFAVLFLSELAAQERYQFTLGSGQGRRLGERVVFLGYPLTHENLCVHEGVISSLYERNGVTVIQLGASVNPGNSGGPLIDPETGEVIGIVSRKADGLTRAIEDLEAEHAFLHGHLTARPIPQPGVDRLIAMHGSFIALTRELRRSANVGFGYALAVDRLAASSFLIHEPQVPIEHQPFGERATPAPVGGRLRRVVRSVRRASTWLRVRTAKPRALLAELHRAWQEAYLTLVVGLSVFSTFWLAAISYVSFSQKGELPKNIFVTGVNDLANLTFLGLGVFAALLYGAGAFYTGVGVLPLARALGRAGRSTFHAAFFALLTTVLVIGTRIFDGGKFFDGSGWGWETLRGLAWLASGASALTFVLALWHVMVASQRVATTLVVHERQGEVGPGTPGAEASSLPSARDTPAVESRGFRKP